MAAGQSTNPWLTVTLLCLESLRLSRLTPSPRLPDEARLTVSPTSLLTLVFIKLPYLAGRNASHPPGSPQSP